MLMQSMLGDASRYHVVYELNGDRCCKRGLHYDMLWSSPTLCATSCVRLYAIKRGDLCDARSREEGIPCTLPRRAAGYVKLLRAGEPS